MFGPGMMKLDPKTNKLISIDKPEILSRLHNNLPLYQVDPSNPESIIRVGLEDFKKMGPLSNILNTEDDDRDDRTDTYTHAHTHTYVQGNDMNEKLELSPSLCPKPPSPPSGLWDCDETGQQCSLICHSGYTVSQPVTIR